MDINNPKPKMPWQEEVNIINRRPRTGMQEIRKLLLSAQRPEIELREDKERKTTEIIVRFPVTSDQLSDRLREIYFGQGMPLEQAFQHTLRMVPNKHQKSLRTQIATLGYNIYRQTWLYLFQILYLDKFHPEANVELRNEFDDLEQATRSRAGRGTLSAIDKANLKQRYEDLLSKCQLVHSAVRKVIGELQRLIPTRRPTEAEIRLKLFEAVRKDLYGTLACQLIFDGKAFRDIARYYGSDVPRLEAPDDWLPEDLAIAVLAFEEAKAFRTTKGNINSILSASQKPLG